MIKKIEEHLISEGYVSNSQLNWARMKQSEKDVPLYRIIIEEGIISEEKYFRVLAEVFDKEFVNLSQLELNSDLVEAIPGSLLEKYNFMPVNRTLTGIKIATFEPNNLFMFQEIEETTGYKVEFCISTVTDIVEAKKRFGIDYDSDIEIENLSELNISEVASKVTDGYGENQDIIEDLEDYDIHSNDAPVVVLVNKLIYDAVKKGATDVHIECFEDKMKVRYRIDGVLRKVMEIEKTAQEPVITRLKIIADLDITERFIPQDGRFKMMIAHDNIDFRITFLPSMYGQNIGIRIFNRKTTPLSFNEIGIDSRVKDLVVAKLKKRHGLILVVGPTGSGKTTTLYTMLNYINSEEIKIITIEDPVEYRLDNIHQIPVRINREDESKSLHFADGLKAILRQDPNVIMIGEIRDKETADIAINAALTGHLVFSTLHANTTVDVISRLKHLGIHPDLVSDSLSMVIAQRLARKKCPECGGVVSAKNSCDFCKGTGYNGRIGIFEVLDVDDDIREVIAAEKASVFIKKEAEKHDYWKTLSESAREMIDSGLVDAEEIETLI
ncbi:MAG: GspE/PulE family protein [Candidatus Muiribacteriaceae bacterium]